MTRSDFLAAQADLFPESVMTLQKIRFQAQAGVLFFGSLLRSESVAADKAKRGGDRKLYVLVTRKVTAKRVPKSA